MAGVVFGRLIYCSRYRRLLHAPCRFCWRVQLWHCLHSPYGVTRASSSYVTSQKIQQVTNSVRRVDHNFVHFASFQKQNCMRLTYQWCHHGQIYHQFIQCYSTQKNNAVPHEDEKDLNEDKIVVERRIPTSGLKECRKNESKTSLRESSSLIASENLDSSETSLTEVSKKTIDSSMKNDKIQSRVQRYLLWRFTWYLNRFQKSLENEMPDTFHMFRIFSIGLKDFVIDFKDFIKVLIILSMPGSTLRSQSRRDIELYYNMPGDMIRVFPVLVLSSLPFGQNIAFPIGYWFPKHLLCHHFWDIKQRHDFAVMSLKKRLFNARAVFRSMQAALLTIENKVDQERCRAAFYKLGSGIHPSTKEIVSLLHLFQGHPFQIKTIRIHHANGLLRLHGKSAWFRPRTNLQDHARMLHYLDTAISREGLESLSFDQLKSSLFLRGVNPTNMSTKSMTDFMESWLCVSREVDASSYSLLLHLPILLAYNQPSNFALIY